MKLKAVGVPFLIDAQLNTLVQQAGHHVNYRCNVIRNMLVVAASVSGSSLRRLVADAPSVSD
jgi:hypothetical protein